MNNRKLKIYTGKGFVKRARAFLPPLKRGEVWKVVREEYGTIAVTRNPLRVVDAVVNQPGMAVGICKVWR